MTFSIIQLIAIFIVPLLIIKYRNFKITKLLGMIGTAYLLGIIVALVIFGLKKAGLNVNINKDIGEIGSHVAIGIAIPLLLFSANLKEVKKLSKTVLLSYGSLIVAVIIVSSITFYVYGKSIENGAELSAMAIGLYSGGTPNLNAIGNIFGLDTTLIGIANLSDMIIGGVFYIFLLLLCKPLLLKFLKPSENQKYLTKTSDMNNSEDLNFKEFKHSKELIHALLLAFLMAVTGALFGIILWIILGSKDGKMVDLIVPSMMITVTVFGIIASFNKKIRATKGTNILGQYLILVFSFALASSLDLTKMQGNFSAVLILYIIITVGAFIIHVLFAKLLSIDADCTIITATAGLYGPAFIPAVTKQIKNDSLTIPGLICGSLGYAIGTFIGVGIGLLFLL